MPIVFRDAKSTDLTAITRLLDSCRLPSVDCAEHIEQFVIAQSEGVVVGVGGMEHDGAVGLIRSIAVVPEQRRQGVGQAIFRRLKGKARRLGVTTLYLLTETAVDYFESFGFAALPRSAAPACIANTKQFMALCPSSATLMVCSISDGLANADQERRR